MRASLFFGHATVECSTPDDLFNELHTEFAFNLDAAAANDESLEAYQQRWLCTVAKADRRHHNDPAAWSRLVNSLCRRQFNAKLPRYFTAESSALSQQWGTVHEPARAFINPPFGPLVGPFLAMARHEIRAGRCSIAVFVLPARTSNAWFHTWVWNGSTHQPHPGIQVRFRRGRDKFGDADTGAPFPTMVVIMTPEGL